MAAGRRLPRPEAETQVAVARAGIANRLAAPPETRPAPAPAVRAGPAACAHPASPPGRVAPPPAEVREAAAPASSGAWSMGAAQALYAEAAHAEGARWLVLAETPAAALQREPFNPFEGEAGKLLDNMLRAARLHKAGVVLLAPLVRGAAAGGWAPPCPRRCRPCWPARSPTWCWSWAARPHRPLLQSSEPFGKLRGQVARPCMAPRWW